MCLWSWTTDEDLNAYIYSCTHFTVTMDDAFFKFETKQGNDDYDNDDDVGNDNDDDDDNSSSSDL